MVSPVLATRYILLAIVVQTPGHASIGQGRGVKFIPLLFCAPRNGKVSSPLRRSGMGTGASTPFV